MNWIGLYTLLQKETVRMFRIMTQTIVAPLVSAALYVFIFGSIVGTKIDEINGVPYITFVFPGILMLSIITAAFAHSSSSIFTGKYFNIMEEVLITPFSYVEIVIGYATAGIVRAVVVALGVLGVGILMDAVAVHSLPLFVFYVASVATIFSLLGMFSGLFARNFDQLSMLTTFIIQPFTYLGGIFYSLAMLPPFAQTITQWNPFFYFVDGIRYSMTGLSEAHTLTGLAVIVVLVVGLALLVTYLFQIGWRIRQ
jgi:ABC-2 type transport system permease protein